MTSHPRDPGWQRVASYLRGLDHALAARLIPLLFPSIRLHSHQVAEPEAIAVGASRLGGCPALPPGVSWPRVEGRALPFLGQFALEEVAPYDLQHVLPAGGGLLSFFYSPDLDLEIELGRGDPTRKDDWRAWRVCVFPSGVSLELAPPPISLLPQEQFFPCTVSFHLEWMLPWWESPQLAQLDLEADYYGTLCQTIAALQPEAQDSQGCLHRLFGYPQAIQGDVFDLLSTYSGGRIAALDWRLLLQLDSDAQAGMQWYDAGSLYFCLPRTALEGGRLSEEIQGVVQYY